MSLSIYAHYFTTVIRRQPLTKGLACIGEVKKVNKSMETTIAVRTTADVVLTNVNEIVNTTDWHNI
jgi:hypothetical protein